MLHLSIPWRLHFDPVPYWVSDYAACSDAILLVVIPSAQAPEVSSLRALRLAKKYDPEGTRPIGVISKIDQEAVEQKILVAVQALLLNQGPQNASYIPWVALIGQSVSIASAQAGSVGSESSLETAWKAESESLRSILTNAPQSKLGRVALVETLSKQVQYSQACSKQRIMAAEISCCWCCCTGGETRYNEQLLRQVLGSTLSGWPLLSTRKLFRWVTWHRVIQGDMMSSYGAACVLL